ncbi:MAG TPA: ATP synthase F1 subunit delta [Acidobacteriota bacterium]|nr:ATP synthase F1 subunit delta [Acidobacteriota bacterium]
MADTRVARKYATGLFAAAKAVGKERAIWDDLAALGELLRTDRRLLRVLASPQLSLDEKKNLVRAILADRAEATVRNFILFLVDKGRTESFPRMIDIYRELLDEAEGIVKATITSAIPLTPEEEKQMVTRLQRISGKTLRYRLEVDPEILGGVVAMLGGQIIDHSVRNDLMHLRDSLRAVKVHEAA